MLRKTTCVFILTLSNLYAPLSYAIESPTYKVRGVKNNDVLNIREADNPDAKIIGFIPFDGSGIIKHDCTRKWCEVTFQGTRGWVNSGYLAKQARSQSNRNHAEPNELIARLAETDVGIPIPGSYCRDKHDLAKIAAFLTELDNIQRAADDNLPIEEMIILKERAIELNQNQSDYNEIICKQLDQITRLNESADLVKAIQNKIEEDSGYLKQNGFSKEINGINTEEALIYSYKCYQLLKAISDIPRFSMLIVDYEMTEAKNDASEIEKIVLAASPELSKDAAWKRAKELNNPFVPLLTSFPDKANVDAIYKEVETAKVHLREIRKTLEGKDSSAKDF